jgi:transposase
MCQETSNSASTEPSELIDHQTMPIAIPAARAAKYEAVVELSKKGHSQRAITRLTGLRRKTVRRYLASDGCPMRSASPRRKSVSRFAKHIGSFLDSGITNAAEIYRRLTAQGFNGSYYMVRRYLKTIQTKASSVAKRITPRIELWSTRKTAWLLSSSSDDLSHQDAARVDAIAHACPDIKIAADLTNGFAKMVRERDKSSFEAWICAATEPHVPKPIRSFAANLMKDQAAVEAALEQPWSNGQLEGQINRLKMLKRQMYGRANLKLLECRKLNAA